MLILNVEMIRIFMSDVEGDSALPTLRVERRLYPNTYLNSIFIDNGFLAYGRKKKLTVSLTDELVLHCGD